MNWAQQSPYKKGRRLTFFWYGFEQAWFKGDLLHNQNHLKVFWSDFAGSFATEPSPFLRECDSDCCCCCYFCKHSVCRIRQYLSKESNEILIHTLISSHIDCCSSLFFKLPASPINTIQRVQNAAARLIFKASKYCHVTTLGNDLHCLPVQYHIEFKIHIIMSYKLVRGLAPNYWYITDKIQLKMLVAIYGPRSGYSNLLLVQNMYVWLQASFQTSSKLTCGQFQV